MGRDAQDKRMPVNRGTSYLFLPLIRGINDVRPGIKGVRYIFR